MFRWNFDGTSMVLRWFFEGFRGFFALFLQSLLPAHCASRTPHTIALHIVGMLARSKRLRRFGGANPPCNLPRACNSIRFPSQAQTSRMTPDGATRELGLWPQCLFLPTGLDAPKGARGRAQMGI